MLDRPEHDDEHWDDDHETEFKACDHCGLANDCYYTNDPFLEQVSGEIDDDSWWCYKCYHDRLNDI